MQIASLTGGLLSSGDFLFMFCFCIWKFLIFSENYTEIPFSVKGKKENRGFLICISLVGCPPACLLKLVNGDARSFPTNTWKANWDILCKLDRYAGCTTTFQTPSTLKFTKIQSIFSISSYGQQKGSYQSSAFLRRPQKILWPS